MQLPNWIKVVKNPRNWTRNYSVVLNYRGARYICSQHNKKVNAEQAASRLVSKYKTASKVHSDYLGWK